MAETVHRSGGSRNPVSSSDPEYDPFGEFYAESRSSVPSSQTRKKKSKAEKEGNAMKVGIDIKMYQLNVFFMEANPQLRREELVDGFAPYMSNHCSTPSL